MTQNLSEEKKPSKFLLKLKAIGAWVKDAWKDFVAWVCGIVTVRDIFFGFLGFTVATLLWYFVYNLLLDSFVHMGKILHRKELYDLIHIIPPSPPTK